MKGQKQRSLDDTPATEETEQAADTQPPATPDTEASDGIVFEEAIDELESIVQELEDGTLGLEEAMDRFERGLNLVGACRSRLEQAELKVQELLEDGELDEVDVEKNP